jgi:hypothetical protein
VALSIDEAATYLQAAGIGTIGTTLFRFALTVSPDAQVALVPYDGGLPSEQAFGSEALKWEFPRLQIVSRGAVGDHRAAMQKAEDAYRAIGRVAAESLSGTFWHGARPLQTPFSMGLDANGRPLYGFNVHIEKEVSA